MQESYRQMKNRNADEITSSILRTAIGGVTKTKMMYEAFITYTQLNEYLSVLIEKGFLQYQEGERVYRTTEKGVRLLQSCEKLTESNKIIIIGLGQLGLPVAKYVKDKGFDNVYGYDISPTAMDRAQKIAGIKKANDFSDFDVYILCVSTHDPEDMFSPQIEGLLAIVDRISKEAKKNGALVSIESTIPRGTSKKVFEILNHRLHVAHAPHRWYALEEKEHGVNQPRVIGGVCDCCLEVAMKFYNGSSSIVIAGSSGGGSNSDSSSDGSGIVGSSSNDAAGNENENGDSSTIQRTTTITRTVRSLGIPMHPVSTIEIAELSKIVENANRYLQIAFAEDLYLYCQANNINFSELRDAVNTKWNVHILEPRDGIGGHCLPKDTKMFLQSSKSIKSKILEAAMEADQDYRQYRQTRASRSTLYTSLLSSSSNLEEDNNQAK